MYLKACDACKIVIEDGTEVVASLDGRRRSYHLCINCGAPIMDILENYKANHILV